MSERAAHTALAHQFDDLDQQRESASLGMWVFLVTEILLFGGLFAGYAAYRYSYPGPFSIGSSELDLPFGAANTAVLIVSSLTMALAVHAAQTGRRRALLSWLCLTILLGSAFLAIKGIEYSEKFEHHRVPGPGFLHQPNEAREVQLFYSFYFVMTGVHALHMVIGIGVMLVILGLAWKGRFTPEYNTPVEVSGLYWHLVDIVWIFLFPLLYLIGRHT